MPETFGSAGSPGAPRHFFLGSEMTKLERRRLLDYGVQPIEYGGKGDHSKLPSVLRHLAEPPGASTVVELTTRAAAPAPLRPRVLVAGPRFGLSDGAWERCLKLWRKGQDDLERAAFLVREELQRSEGMDSAQIAAIVRYDVIVDLSPWGAFRRWSSIGFRNADEVDDQKVLSAPLFFCACAAPGATKGASLREMGPDLRGHIQSLLPHGLAVCGLSEEAGEPTRPRASSISGPELGCWWTSGCARWISAGLSRSETASTLPRARPLRRGDLRHRMR